MAYPKNQRSALLALAASAGLWAWQNRDKITSWVDQQRSQLAQRQPTTTQPSITQPATTQPTETYTGATRRFDDPTPLSSRPDVVLGDTSRDM